MKLTIGLALQVSNRADSVSQFGDVEVARQIQDERIGRSATTQQFYVRSQGFAILFNQPFCGDARLLPIGKCLMIQSSESTIRRNS